ncbi:hypothetical protein D0B54_08575 [Solimonas sp. K1W22B-7]|uniref:alpha/beta hydrolase family esterase n=1 Tax=Solimonas sp. K1W22B-7 TaxID=2303331 RepID=UPI000E33144B|nr:PHB depolymerase family esterase [Solimonas sp. K1W22B-7]AXQ28733.1 hypothetical protein D0B54_08575 [Solimonas sp. K1W22B-7]
MFTRKRLRRTLFALPLLLAPMLGFSQSASAACTLSGNGTTVTKTVAGFRSYNLHVPANLSGPKVPLLLSMHGVGVFPWIQEITSGWSPYADTHNFIVAYPAGQFNVWDLGAGSTDVAFLRNVVNSVAAQYCVDPKQVYLDGGSLGGFMAQRAACEAEDVFASATSWAGGPPTLFGACNLSRPVAVALFHGEADTTVSPTAMGMVTRDEWVARNGCNTTPVVEGPSEGTLLRYVGCGAGVEVLWRTYPGQTHDYPTGARLTDLHDRMWAFHQAHQLP